MKLLKMSNFIFFHNVFYAILSLNLLIATFQLSSAASLNLGHSQNGVLGNGLTDGLFNSTHILFVVCTAFISGQSKLLSSGKGLSRRSMCRTFLRCNIKLLFPYFSTIFSVFSNEELCHQRSGPVIIKLESILS